jgi:hypothetical protein
VDTLTISIDVTGLAPEQVIALEAALCAQAEECEYYPDLPVVDVKREVV